MAPIATIAGANTMLTQPMGLALDASDNIYVSTGNGTQTIRVHQANSNGNATISGAAVLFPRALAIGP